jgi:hypothetical protein
VRFPHCNFQHFSWELERGALWDGFGLPVDQQQYVPGRVQRCRQQSCTFPPVPLRNVTRLARMRTVCCKHNMPPCADVCPQLFPCHRPIFSQLMASAFDRTFFPPTSSLQEPCETGPFPGASSSAATLKRASLGSLMRL